VGLVEPDQLVHSRDTTANEVTIDPETGILLTLLAALMRNVACSEIPWLELAEPEEWATRRRVNSPVEGQSGTQTRSRTLSTVGRTAPPAP
jgi:hypothetical protein